MGQEKARRWGFLAVAALCCAVFMASTSTATVRLSETAAPASDRSAHDATAIVSAAVAVFSAGDVTPTTHKHCPRSGSRLALPACASPFGAVYHAVVDDGWSPPPLVVSRASPPGNDAAAPQWSGLPPLRPPRRLA